MDNGSVKSGSQADGHTRALSEKYRRLEHEKQRLRALVTETASIFRLGQPNQSRKSPLRDWPQHVPEDCLVPVVVSRT